MRKVGKLEDIYEFISEYIKNRLESEHEYIVTIKKKQKTRTLQMNKLIHVLFEIIRSEEEKLGNEYSFDEIKNIMKMALIGIKEITFGKFVIQYPLKGTSELTIEEGNVFIDKIIYWCNEKYGLEISSKDDERLLEYYDNYIK